MTVTNRSETVRSIRLHVNYLDPKTRALLKTRTLRMVIAPPFTETAVSGYTRFLESRSVIGEAHAAEVEPET